MDEKIIFQLCRKYFCEYPGSVERCTVGHGNYVFIVEFTDGKKVVRCSLEHNAYQGTVSWLKRLASLKIPAPKVLALGKVEEYEFLILSYIEGRDIGIVYPQLKYEEKKMIAKEIVSIQNRVAELELVNVESQWSWSAFLYYILHRARERIAEKGYFSVEKVDRLLGQMEQLEGYFASVKPIAYLDDISSKNLLIHNGRISGIIDVDWIGAGDKLTYVALTNMVLLDLGYDTDYVQCILEEMQISDTERRAFLYYTLMYCVDFMGERGMCFMGRIVEVNQHVVDRLNHIYDFLWDEWRGVEHLQNTESH